MKIYNYNLTPKLSMRFMLLLLFILAVLIRLSGVNLAPYSDEEILYNEMNIDYKYFIGVTYHEHPPVTFISMKILSMLFGVTVPILRLVPIIYSLLLIFVVYRFAKHDFDDSVSFWAFFIMGFSFYTILGSLQLDVDMPLLLFFTLSLFYFRKFTSNLDMCLNFSIKKLYLDYNLRFAGIFSGLVLLTKYHGIIIFGIIFFSLLFQLKGSGLKNMVKRSLLITLVIFSIGILVFSIYPLYAYFTDFGMFQSTIQHMLEFGDHTTNVPLFVPTIILFLWATPLLLILSFISVLRFDKRYVLYYLWIIFNLIFNFFIIRKGDYSRYFMLMIPALAILSADVISNLKLKARDYFYCISFIVISYSVFYYFNTLPMKHLPQFIGNYITELKNFNLKFFFPYAISHGSWFGTNFINIFIISLITLILIVPLCVLYKKGLHMHRKFLFILFLGIMFGFNIFLTGEELFHLSQPNPSKGINLVIKYIKENKLYNTMPIYATDKAILAMIDHDYLDNPSLIRLDGDEQIVELSNRIIPTTGAYIIFTDFATYIQKEDIDELPGCRLLNKFEGITYLYECTYKNTR